MRKVTTHVDLVDDLDGSEATQTIKLGYADRWYELDLSDANVAGLEAALAAYLTAGRPPASPAPAKRRGRGSTKRHDNAQRNAAIRAWAADQGMAVSPRGTLSRELVAAFDAAVGRGDVMASSTAG